MVTVTSDRLAVSVNLDPRCTLLGINRATCHVLGAATLRLLVATLAARADHAHDHRRAGRRAAPSASSADNTTHVRLVP